MEIQSQFNQLSSRADIAQILEQTKSKTAYDMNCMRIGIIQEFYPDNLTAKVLITNKRMLGINQDGTTKSRNFAPIYAKVCFASPYNTFPITQGMECILLFNDREIESWFINGDVNTEKYPRMHDLSDAIAIVGIRSMPRMIKMMADCVNFFNGNSNIEIHTNAININSSTVTAQNLHATNGASGSIRDTDGKTLATVVDGIITEIF